MNVLSLVRIDFEIKDLEAIVPSLLFLLPYFVIKRYRMFDHVDHFLLFFKAVPYGGILLMPWIFYEAFFLEIRMVGGAGNSIPFGMICALMFPICLMNILSCKQSGKYLAAFGAVIFLLGLAYSGSRAMQIASILNLFIALTYLVSRCVDKRNGLLTAVVILLGCITFVANSNFVQERFSLLVQPAINFYANQEIKEESFGHRVALLKKGLCFAQLEPIFGYGIANRREILISGNVTNGDYFGFCNGNHQSFHYSHFHNGFVTAFIDAGIFGLLVTIAMLVAPLILALSSPRDGLFHLRLSITLCLISVYLAAGFTNLLFGHDLIDAIFLIFCTFLTLSVREKQTEVSLNG